MYEGVVKGAIEDPYNIPSQEASTPTEKQVQTALNMQIKTEEQVRNDMCCEVATCTPNEATYIKETLERQQYDLMTDEEIYQRYNSIREAYGMPKIKKRRFKDSLEGNRWEIMHVIKRYDEMLQGMIAEMVSKVVESINSNNDNNNINPMDTMKIRDFKDIY
jgi:hypothetical protein